MSGWQPTGAMIRALVLGIGGLAYGAAAGEPALLVLTAPLLVAAAVAAVMRPRQTPQLRVEFDHATLSEGQAGVVRLRLSNDAGVEQVTRVSPPAPHLRYTPARGRIAATYDPQPEVDPAESTGRERGERDQLEVVVSPRRWGVRTIGAERVALTSPWCGFCWGPVTLVGQDVRVLPTPPPLESRAEQPRPHGLVGAHRSSRPGAGTELAGIRTFQPGDRLRRIHWPVSARTGTLHVTTTRAEQDAGLMLVVDLLAEYGVSGGVDGAESSLDVTVRAAAAFAELAVHRGDRVSLRAAGGRARAVPPGSGRRHLRRVLGSLADVAPGDASYDAAQLLTLRVEAGTTVVLLSPLLSEAIATAAATLTRRGVPTVIIDTLPGDVTGDLGDRDPGVADLAWRMRLLEREQVTSALDAIGCPVVPWRGRGSIDDVFRGLRRRAEQTRALRS